MNAQSTTNHFWIFVMNKATLSTNKARTAIALGDDGLGRAATLNAVHCF